MTRGGILIWVSWATVLATVGAEVPVVDATPEWVVGVSAFVDDGLSPGDRYLLNSIPLRLIERLQPIHEHQLGPQERYARRARVLQAEVRLLSERVDGLQRALGDASLGDRPTETAQRQLAEAIAQLEELRQVGIDDVVVPERKRVRIASGSDLAQLYQAAAFSPQQFATREGLDLLIGGSVGAVDGFFFIDVTAFGSARGEQVFGFHDAVPAERVVATLDELGNQLATLLLGSAWATLQVSPTPASAEVRIDARFVGVGATVVPFLAAGEHVVEVSALGYVTQQRVVTVAPDGHTAIAPELAVAALPLLPVSSLPSPADVYVDSVWAGRTPLQVAVAPGITRLELRSEGFHAQSAELTGASSAPLSFTLEPATGDLQEQQEAERDRFYRTLGWFAASTTLPIILGMAAGDATARVNTLIVSPSQAGIPNALELRAWLIGGAVTGVVASGVSFAISMFALSDYLQAANRAAR